MDVKDLRVYNSAMEIADDIWSLTSHWNQFPRKSLADQLIRSSDSIAANIAEGFGRYHYKENKKFCYDARGSLVETLCWLEKSRNRQLISAVQHNSLLSQLKQLQKQLNAYISTIGKRQ